ncbi:MAG: hypothetical protein IJ123_04855 [Blautia sp.]|nr:hypothetical protein [Blautia sp.]
MIICTCGSCRYIFNYPLVPQGCPDCGKGPVRIANKTEVKEYYRLQRILRDEIRRGLYPAVG